LRALVKAQAEAAVAEADLIILLLDVLDGPAPADEEIAGWLRRSSKPLVAAVNKVDNPKRELSVPEFHALGLGEPLPISAYHDLGVYDLMDRVVSLLPAAGDEPGEEPPDKAMKVAIIGRTNVGKSMLANSILGQERSIVSDVPGTTRDALDTRFSYNGSPVVLIDTAGLRRPGKVTGGIEYYSVLRALRAVERCDIAVLVLDGTELGAAQDAHISAHAWDGYRGLIVAVNKWDLVPQTEGTERELAVQAVRQQLHFMPYVPICFTSALTGEGVLELMDLASSVYRERLLRVQPGRLHHTLMDALASHTPPSRKGKRLRIDGVRQVDVNPPTFVFAVNNPKLVHFSYQRYLENRFRSAFGFTHTHLRLVFRERI
jgi:GTP-binding protein